jgi:PIN domain nuclease of toxin-antitoxin system
LIWFSLGDARVPKSVIAVIQADDSEVLVSAVSFYEIALKRRRGRMPPGLPTNLAAACASAGFVFAPITVEDAESAGALPELHRDPWDRILVAQGLHRQATLITKDAVLAAYGVPTLW